MILKFVGILREDLIFFLIFLNFMILGIYQRNFMD